MQDVRYKAVLPRTTLTPQIFSENIMHYARKKRMKQQSSTCFIDSDNYSL